VTVFPAKTAPLAQLAEQLTLNQRVAGSIPARCMLDIEVLSSLL
jgi:hypothetical protein